MKQTKNFEALEPYWDEQRKRSVDLVQLALSNLQGAEETLTRQKIHEETKRVDKKDGRGVHPTTYRRNPQVNLLVSAALGEVAQVETTLDLRDVNIINLRPGRKLLDVFHRLRRKSPKELARRVIVLEEEVLSLRNELAEAYGLEPLKRGFQGEESEEG